MSDCKLKNFLTKHQNDLIPNLDNTLIKAKPLTISLEDLQKAADAIQNNQLVAFPTETVYGLGANALNEEAVLKIYTAKRRPLSDPVIVHVTSQEQALALVDIDIPTKELFLQITDIFWPGPLTVILKANDKISSKITANTGYVGIRYPNHPIAQQLINMSQRPIVAPSANVFCHVSPTCATHVFNDLYDQELYILEGEVSQLGIESTVLKIIDEKEVQILRNGSVSASNLQLALGNRVKVLQKMVFAEQNQEQFAPGQFLKHYAPYLDTFTFKAISEGYEGKQSGVELKDCALLDFDSINSQFKSEVKYYLTFNEKKDLKEVMKNLYEKLRQAENLKYIKTILITDLDKIDYHSYSNPDFSDTIYDKIRRCTQGRTLFYDSQFRLFF